MENMNELNHWLLYKTDICNYVERIIKIDGYALTIIKYPLVVNYYLHFGYSINVDVYVNGLNREKFVFRKSFFLNEKEAMYYTIIQQLTRCQ